MSEIIITIEGGVVQDVQRSDTSFDNIKIVVHDFDCEDDPDAEDKHPNTEWIDGRPCWVMEW